MFADLAVIVSVVHGREIGLLGAMPVDVIETQAVIDRQTTGSAASPAPPSSSNAPP